MVRRYCKKLIGRHPHRAVGIKGSRPMSGLLRTVRFAIAIGEFDTGRDAGEYLFVDAKRPLVIAKARALCRRFGRAGQSHPCKDITPLAASPPRCTR